MCDTSGQRCNAPTNIATSVTPPADLEGILRREAVYCALGRNVHKLRDLINWNEWLNILAQEAQSSNPDYRLVKRRIAWLLGKWHADDSGQVQTNPLVWQILLALLTDRSPASDLVVRLSASAALYQCLEVKLEVRGGVLRISLTPDHRTLISVLKHSSPSYRKSVKPCFRCFEKQRP